MNIAILAICDFEKWNNPDSSGIGGIAGVIKSILPHIQAEKIYLLGITSEKQNLKKVYNLTDKIVSYPLIYIPKKTCIPERLITFWYSRKINKTIKRFKISSIYSHCDEMLFWVQPTSHIVNHMHGSTNALSKAKKKFLRNKLFQQLWAMVRKSGLKKSKHIIAIDNLCLNIAKKYRCEEKAILIPNFVDTSVFFYDNIKSDLLRNINERIVLFVGRLEEVKGLELFVDIVTQLKGDETGVWKGVIIGDGTYKKTIANYILNKSDPNLFHFTGAIYDQQELRRIYSQSEVLIISSYYEGIPMVVLESLACGTKVISTNVGGIKELISDDKNCFVINERNYLLFAEQIMLLNKYEEYNESEKFKFSVKDASIKINNLLQI